MVDKISIVKYVGGNILKNSTILTGLATGAIVSTAYMMTQNKKPKQQDTMKKFAGSALKTVGSVIENTANSIK